MSDQNCNCPYPDGPPYGGGIPNPPGRPIDGECVPDTSDPCADSSPADKPCPNTICDERLLDVPQSRFVRLLGAVGKCFHTLFRDAKGFVVSTPQGEMVTNRPCVDIPYLKNYQRDPQTGEFITDSDGDLVEGMQPPFDSFVVAEDECGCQNRVQGLKGERQQIIWDGEEFIFEPAPDLEDNPVIDQKLFPQSDDPCVKTAVLVPRCVTKYINGQPVKVSGYQLGTRSTPIVPYGTVQPFAGPPENIPGGWALADGSELNVDEWPDLFAAIGYAWGGSGDTFCLPDLRGQFIRGVDGEADLDPDADSRTEIKAGGNTGNAVGSIQQDQMQCFGVEYQRTTCNDGTIRVSQYPGSPLEQDLPVIQGCGGGTQAATIIDDGCGELRVGDEIRPKNAYVNYIVHTGCIEE